MSAYTLYFYIGRQTGWRNDNAVFKLNSSNAAGGTTLTRVGTTDWYSCSTTASGTMYIVRCNSAGDTKWNSFSCSVSSTNNVVRLTDWNAGGTFSMYVTGDGWNSIGSWDNANANGKMTISTTNTFSKTFTNVAASAHEFKIVEQGRWDYSVGWGGTITNTNCDKANSNGNIQFTPYIATGSTTITYNISTGAITVTCPKIPITLNKNSGASNGSATVDVGASSLSSITHVSRDYYDLTGYWTASSGGYKVITAAGAFVTYSSNVSEYLNNATPVTWKKTSATILYAQWTPKTYNITYKDEGGSSYSGSNSASLPSSYTYGTGIASLTDGVKSGYRFDGWFTESTCSGDPVTSISSSANGAKTFYAKWTENPGGTVTLTAGTGGQVSKNGSSWGASTSYTGIKSATPLNIYAQANTGYTFNTWTKSSGSGTITTNAASGVFTPVANADAALTASFTETMSTLSTSCHYDAGNPSYAAPTVSGSATTVGYATTRTITATAAGTGYTFAGWTLTNCTRTDGGAATATQITIRSNGDGAAATVVANYNEVLTSTYHVEGDANGPFTYGWNANANTMMMKRSGSSTSSDVYWDLEVPASKTSPADNQWEFKIYNDASTTGEKWYGWGNGSDHYWLTKANNNLTLSTTGSNTIYLKCYVEGTYTFHVNYSTPASPTLEVIWPTINQLRISTASPADATNTNNFDLTDQGSNNWSVTRTLNANTTYTFKMVYDAEWYGKNSTALTRDANTASSLNTDGDDMTIETDLAGDYTFTFNSSTKNLTVTYPTRYTITYAIGAVNGTSGSISATPSVASGDYVVSGTVVTLTAPIEKSGYEWYGWYGNEDGTGVQLCSTKEYAVTVNADKTVYACYKKLGVTLECSPTIVTQSGTVTATPSIYPAPTPGSYVICWRLLHSNGNLVESQPTFTPTGVGDAVSFTAPSTSGMYLIAAIQHSGSNCNAGEVLDSVTTSLQVAGDHTVTVQYKCGNETIKESTTVTGRPLTWSSVINPPEIFGYTFSRWVAVDGVTLSTDGTSELGSDNTTTPAIYIKAIYDGKLKAEYTQNQYIYFKNTLNWSNVYVNFYTDSYWNNPKGSGNSGVTNKNLAMTRIGETDTWYYDYGGASITPTLYVSFTSESQNGSENFWHKSPDVNVVYPANYPDAIHTNKSAENGFKAATPMFVPLESQAAIPLNSSDGGKANYYNAGYWTKYTPGTGYTLEIYYDDDESPTIKSISFTSDNELMPMKAIASLEANTTYRYQLRRGGTGDDGIYYGNTGTMTYSNHEAWDMNNSMFPFKKAKITTNAAGDYTFNLNYAGHKDATTNYRLRMSVDYPIATGDYRLIYKDGVHTAWHPSAIVPQVNNGKDTVSFFIRPGNSPQMKIQQATVANNGAITWSTGTSVTTSTLTALAKDSVYNVCLTMDGSGAISVAKIEPYTGNFYIRTDPANSKWDNYRSDPDHLMTYSEYSITHGGYSHYFCHWVQTDDRKNIKFCIANDYSPCISDTLIRETASGTWEHIADFIDDNGNILRNANVRFMWDQHTNTISRAYIDGAYISGGDDFLVLVSGDSKILNPSTSAVQATTTFYDNQNWIYEANVKAIPNAQIKLRSIWGKDGETTHKITQYFKGGTSSTETLITGSGSDPYDIRLLYDFKTNRLVAAMLPSGNYDDPEAIHADVMFIRDHQGDVSQLTFTDDGKITDINTAYAVIQLNKWTLNNKERTGSHAPLGAPASIYERSLYFISFPFQVNLSEVFGFGTYGEHWAIQYYDGEERAAKGYWMGDPGFWKFYWDRRNIVLEPNKGYLLAIDLDLLGEESDVWANGNERAELFFPSAGSLGSITNSTVTKSLHEHACTIDRSKDEFGNPTGLPDTPDNPHTSYNRTIFDSHWNVMGVPTYVNTAAQSWANTSWITATVDHKTQGPNFLYTWNMDDNTLTPTSGASFKYHAMHSYMVQYYGNVTWKTAQGPAAIVARRAYAAAPKNVEFCIEISDSEKMLDRTFLRLSEDEEVSANFAFNEDMTKDMNGRKANIYTLTADNVAAAGNTMPLNDQTLIVPLNVVTWTADNFTISIPEGTSGIGVTLVDEETGERTNLALGDYSRYLEKGTYSNRFHLEIAPIKQVPTGLEPTSDSSLEGRAQKRLIDGKLYILRDGKVYDARGNKVE